MQDLIASLVEKGNLTLTTAESCTGGMIAAAITDMAGASVIFDRGFITYSNESKHALLDVSLSLIGQYGAVSSQVVQAMAEGALTHSAADVSIAVTGIAGPEGGSNEKPVGTVFIACAQRAGSCKVERFHFSGDRAAVRSQTVAAAFALIKRQINI